MTFACPRFEAFPRTAIRRTMLAMCLIANCTAAAAAEGICPQADEDFIIKKTTVHYDLQYRTLRVHRIESGELKDLFGHAEPSTECDRDLSSRAVIGLVVGWRKDLLIAFGIVRSHDGRPVRLNKLKWTPHGERFSPIMLVQEDEYVVHYGDRSVRICWNRGGRQMWEFSSNHHEREPGGCNTTVGPHGSSQLLLPLS